MTNTAVLLILSLYCFVNYNVYASTHWVVTEGGRIQQQIESSFAMVQPDNLAGFINQERVQNNLKEMQKDLIKRHQDIEANEDKDTDLEMRHYNSDENCLRAGKRFSEFDLFIHSFLPLTDKGIQISDHITLDKNLPFNQPNCSEFFNLPYSVHSYDHLLAVQQRNNLERQPLERLKKKMSFLKKPKIAASAIYEALKKNSTSWVLYNLASFYWRLEGNTSASIECIRRALHFSPEKTKDIALVNLANVLHQADYTQNATVVLLHALDISGGKDFVNYYHLGNMFASLGNFNRSIFFYEKTLQFKKDFEPAISRLAGVRCELKLQDKLEVQHQSLQRTLAELQEYRNLHDKFREEQELASKQHIGIREQVEAHLFYEQQKLKEGAYSDACQFKNKDDGSGPYLLCEFSQDEKEFVLLPGHHQNSADDKYGRNIITASPIRHISEKKKKVENEEEPETKRFFFNESDSEEKVKIDPQKKIYHSYVDYTHPKWPPLESCKQYTKRYPHWDEFPSGYVDPETRGFPVRKLLTTYLGIAPGEMHATPWKQPHCDQIEENPDLPYDSLATISTDIDKTAWKQDPYVNNLFLKHVNGGAVWSDDIAQRILSALKIAKRKQNYDHLWVLYNLAGLFWRVNGDNKEAIQCLRRSIYHAPKHHRDIPLVGIANILYRNGHIYDSLNLLIHALQLNNSEPATYLTTGNVLQENNNATGAIQFYNYALVLYPDYSEALQSLLIVKCFQMIGSGPNSRQVFDEIKKEVAKEQEDAKEQEEVAEEQEEVAEKQEDAKEEDTQMKIKSSDSSSEHPSLIMINSLSGSMHLSHPPKTQIKDHIPYSISSQNTAEQAYKDGNLSYKDTSLADKSQISVLEKNPSKDVDQIEESNPLERSFLDLQVDQKEEDQLTNEDDPYCQSLTKMDFSQLDALNTTELFLNEVDFSLDVAIDDRSDLLKPTCVVDNDENFIYDFQPVKTQSSKPELRLDAVAKSFIEEMEAPGSLSSYLAAAFTSHPYNWRVAVLSSFYWRTVGDVKQTFACLQFAMTHVQPCYRDIVVYVVVDYMAHLGRLVDASSLCEKLVDRHPYSPAVSYLLGNLYAAQGFYMGAVKSFQMCLKLRDNYEDAQNRIDNLNCLKKSGK